MHLHNTQRFGKDRADVPLRQSRERFENTDRDTGSFRTLHECLSESSAVGWNMKERKYAVLQLDLRRKQSNEQTYDPN